ncbi:MAG: protease, partial [Chloroflexi bacterium]|nr:protease [Chloroflexota bacterium]
MTTSVLRPRLILEFVVLLALVSYCAPARSATAAGSPPPPTISQCIQRFHQPCVTPALVQTYYGVDALLRHGIRGQGRTIAIIDSFGSATLQSDLQHFDRAFGLPDPQLTVLAPLGKNQPKNSGWAAETTLDVEWAHAMAPDARIVVLESPVDETEGVQGLPQFLKLEQYVLQHHLADVISQSWGATEETLLDASGRQVVAQFHQLYADAARRGVTVVAGSGDDGAGGIDLSLKKLFPEPAYQKPLPATVQHLLGGNRGLPDVAFNASGQSAALIYFRGQWHPVAGTSAAAPQWA